MMIIRTFNSKFSGKLNGLLAEDSEIGFYPTYLRFHIYLDDMNRSIEETNQATLEELRKEDSEIAASMAGQPHIETQLYYFSDMLVNGIIVSLYSYLDNQVAELNKLCRDSDVWLVDGTRKNENFGGSDLVKKIKPIYNWVLGEDFNSKTISADLLELMSWTKVRNDLVHKNGEANGVDDAFLKSNQIELGISNISMSKSSALQLNSSIYKFLSGMVDQINTKHNLITKTTI
jgi:hypothetical protein